MVTDETSPLVPNAVPQLDTDLPLDDEAMSTLIWKTGAVFGAAAVGLGAFGAHGLKKHISDPNKLANWSTAAQYHLIHSVALLAAAGNPTAGALFTAGITMFSGSLYALTLDTERFRFLGPVTPIGGVCLMAGWLALGFGKRGAGMRWPRF
ncbi:hypothetical protein C8A05DRAFT_39766 [Staphylotrichum tortipilum]|uniref:DUF423-domain-containing protein n=1 Tax=Staphylotrichum tortipilum TaxID=2831512 RepID=A0AAN6RNL6_9PEZI|nr:hypothetical protein C8A05DRAFT_39766 [Staphylotrichum longicolle]